MAFVGSLAKLASDLTGQDFTSGAVIGFDAEEYDVGGWHDTSTNNTRLTVPPGVTRVRVYAQVSIQNIAAANDVRLLILKNGALHIGAPLFYVRTVSDTANIPATAVNIASPPLTVTPGDYFEAQIVCLGDSSVDLDSARTYLAIEQVQGLETFNGALADLTSNRTSQNFTTASDIDWDAEEYDDGGWWASSPNPTRLTVPAGVSRVRVGCTVTISSAAADGDFSLLIKKNGSLDVAGVPGMAVRRPQTTASAGLTVKSPPIEVSSGDYFESNLHLVGDSSITLHADRSHFSIENVP